MGHIAWKFNQDVWDTIGREEGSGTELHVSIEKHSLGHCQSCRILSVRQVEISLEARQARIAYRTTLLVH